MLSGSQQLKEATPVADKQDALLVATPVAEHASMDTAQLLAGSVRGGRSCAVLPYAINANLDVERQCMHALSLRFR